VPYQQGAFTFACIPAVNACNAGRMSSLRGDAQRKLVGEKARFSVFSRVRRDAPAVTAALAHGLLKVGGDTAVGARNCDLRACHLSYDDCLTRREPRPSLKDTSLRAAESGASDKARVPVGVSVT
jgi:hypothetical protein